MKELLELIARSLVDNPDEVVVRWESVTQVRAALLELPSEQQKIVRMRIYEQKYCK